MRSGLSLASFSLFAAGILLASASDAKVITYTFTPLSSLGGNSYASAINNSGKIVGYSYLPNNSVFHAVRWNGSTATDIGTLNGKNSEASGINDSGQIVGQSWDADDMPRPVLWNGSQVTDLGTLGGRVGFAGDINSSGQIAGQSDSSLGQRLATRWDAAGVITNLGTLDGNHSYASAINTHGQIVGTSYASPFAPGAGNPTHATLWNGAFATDLDPNGSYSSAYDINDHRQIVGSVQQPEVPDQSRETHATLWNGITPVDLGTLGGSFSDARAINNAGQVVGYSDTIPQTHSEHAFLWNGTTMSDLNSFLHASTVSAGWVLVEAMGINDKGWIVGTAYNSTSGVNQAFLLAPEPKTYALMLAGLCLIGFVTRRKKAENRV